MRVLFSTCAWSSACSNETKVTCQLKVLALVVTGDRRSMVNVPAVFVLASGVDQFLNFFVGNDVVPPARGSVHIFRIVVQVTAANFEAFDLRAQFGLIAEDYILGRGV